MPTESFLWNEGAGLPGSCGVKSQSYCTLGKIQVLSSGLEFYRSISSPGCCAMHERPKVKGRAKGKTRKDPGRPLWRLLSRANGSSFHCQTRGFYPSRRLDHIAQRPQGSFSIPNDKHRIHRKPCGPGHQTRLNSGNNPDPWGTPIRQCSIFPRDPHRVRHQELGSSGNLPRWHWRCHSGLRPRSTRRSVVHSDIRSTRCAPLDNPRK